MDNIQVSWPVLAHRRGPANRGQGTLLVKAGATIQGTPRSPTASKSRPEGRQARNEMMSLSGGEEMTEEMRSRRQTHYEVRRRDQGHRTTRSRRRVGRVLKRINETGIKLPPTWRGRAGRGASTPRSGQEIGGRYHPGSPRGSERGMAGKEKVQGGRGHPRYGTGNGWRESSRNVVGTPFSYRASTVRTPRQGSHNLPRNPFH